MSSWKDSIQEDTSPEAESWKNSILTEDSSEIPLFETAKGQALQGATFGFGDELVAAGAALADIREREDTDLSKYKELYNKYLQSEREQLKKEAEANPKTALASNLAGGLILPGGAILKGAKTAKLIGVGAGMGALSGLGTSEAETTSDLLKDVGTSAVGGAILSPAIPAAGKLISSGIKATPKLTQGALELAERLPIAGKGISALRGSLQGKKYYKNEEEYANQLLNQAEELVESTRSLGIDVFKNKRKLLEEAKKSGKVADLEQFYDDSIKELETLPGKLTEGFEDQRAAILNEFRKRRFGDKELVPEQRIKSEGEYTELVPNRPELERQLELEALKAKSLGEQVVPQIDVAKTSAGEEILLPKLIKNLETGESVSALKPIEAVSKIPRKNVTEVVKAPYEKIKDLPKTIQTPSQVEDLIKETRAILDDPNSSQFHSFARQRLKELQSIQNELIPGLEQANKESSSAMQLFNFLTGKNIQDVVPGFNEADLLRLETGLAKDVLQKQSSDPYKRIEMQKLLEGFKKVKGVKDISPETANKISNILEKSKVSSKDLDLARIVSEDTSPYIQAGLEKAAIMTGEGVGRGARAISKIPANIVRAVTPESAQILAARAAQKGNQALSNVLTKMSEKENDQTRKALMFSIMQNPEYRQTLNEIGGDILGKFEGEE